jgi:hypothetical protein
VLVECPATATLPAWKRAFHVDGGSGLGGQDDRLLVVGLGQYEEGTVKVFWPDGATTTKAFTSGDINKTTEVFEIEDQHAPGILPGSVTGSVALQPNGHYDWIIQWKNRYTTDETFDRADLRPKAGKNGTIPPECLFSPFTLTPSSPNVTHTVTVSGSDLLHRLVWSSSDCAAPCIVEFDVYSKFNDSEESVLNGSFTISICVQ